jgi:hypothetical protein
MKLIVMRRSPPHLLRRLMKPYGAETGLTGMDFSDGSVSHARGELLTDLGILAYTMFEDSLQLTKFHLNFQYGGFTPSSHFHLTSTSSFIHF